MSIDQNFFNDKGYLILESFFSELQLEGVNESIAHLEQSSAVDLYKDRQGKLRRMENFTFRAPELAALNQAISDLLLGITGEKWILFKDKVNFKPPSGGFFILNFPSILIFFSP